MTLLEAAQALRRRTVSSAELTEEALKRIGELNPKLNAMLTTMEESARTQAKAADEELARGADRGPLHGIPIAVKDVFETRGVRTTCGSVIFLHHVPDRDAAVVERLAAAARCSWARPGCTSWLTASRRTIRTSARFAIPAIRSAIPGGSSGGSGAAVASEMVFMAMGSDTGGSIRIPASFCGTVGLKPTSGRVSRYGVMPLDFSLDHMGPLTRSVRDAAVTLQAIAGYDPRDETSSPEPVSNYLPDAGCSIRELRIGLPQNFYFERLDPDVDMAVRRMAATAESLGACILPVRVPDIDALNAVGRVILLAEASALMEKYIGNRDQFGSDVLALLDQGRLLPATDYVNAQRLRRMMQRDFAHVMVAGRLPVHAHHAHGRAANRGKDRAPGRCSWKTCGWRRHAWCAGSTCWDCPRFQCRAAATGSACRWDCRSLAARSTKP